MYFEEFPIGCHGNQFLMDWNSFSNFERAPHMEHSYKDFIKIDPMVKEEMRF